MNCPALNEQLSILPQSHRFVESGCRVGRCSKFGSSADFCYNFAWQISRAAASAVTGKTMSLTHFDEQGRAHMVDVGHKNDTQREAVARGRVLMKPETLVLIQEGGIKKGDVLAVAQVAGIMAAKRTHELVPMCHPLMLTHVSLQFDLRPPDGLGQAAVVNISATVRTTGKTGVEMEALTAVSVAGLTIYDMCKAVDRAMQIDAVRLAKKSGGKSGDIVLE
jgi:cyclic pyranopterin phosphate synthase